MASQAALALSLMGVASLSAGCAGSGSGSNWGCSDAARKQTQALVADLGQLSTVMSPAFMDDCDSGGQVYVTFYVTALDRAIAEFQAAESCRSGSSPGVELEEGDRPLRCTFPSGYADVVLSKDPLRGEAEAAQSGT